MIRNALVTIDAIEIGDYYLGGMVAYILKPGDPGYDPLVPHGLIASTEDLGDRCQWALGRRDSIAVGTTGMTIGTGRANTEAIVKKYGAGYYAAYIAHKYSGGGFTDWYLPSACEMFAIRRTMSMTHSFYHTSSESDNGGAYIVWNDRVILAEPKYSGRHVRAVRDF